MNIVYDGNNSNSVCFVGKLCSFENLLVRVDHSQSDLKTLKSRFSNEHNYLQKHAIV